MYAWVNRTDPYGLLYHLATDTATCDSCGRVGYSNRVSADGLPAGCELLADPLPALYASATGDAVCEVCYRPTAEV